MCAVSSNGADSRDSERNPQATRSATRAGTAIRWGIRDSGITARAYREKGCPLFVEVVRNAGDDDVAAEEERPLDEEGALVVQQVVPPPGGHELRKQHGDEVSGAFV